MICIPLLKRSRSFGLLFLVLCVSMVLFMTTSWSLKLRGNTMHEIVQSHYRVGQATSRYTDVCHNNKSRSLKNKAIISINKLVTPKFLPNFRNPCWTSEPENTTLLCLPYFYVAGFPKCGTTDLYQRITDHPLIAHPSYKEPHYLTRKLYTETCSKKYPQNASSDCYVNEYASLFFQWPARVIASNSKFGYLPHADISESTDNINRQASGISNHPFITLDSSASTAWDASNWEFIEENQGCSEPAFLPADIVIKLNPNVSIIMIMREPVQRAYSDYLYFNEETSPEDFHHRVSLFLKFYESCLKNNSIRHCVYDVKNHENFLTRARLEIGLYQVYIHDWLQRLTRDRFLFLRLEDYSKNVTGTVQDLFQFLQLPQLSQDAVEKIGKKARANENQLKHQRKPMLPETDQLLKNFYAAYNKKLAQLLDDERFTWRDVASST